MLITMLFAALAGVSYSTSRQETTTFLVRLGIDTVAIEQVERTGRTYRGTIVRRSPVTLVQKYELVVAEDGRPDRFTLAQTRPDGTVRPDGRRRVTLEMRADSLTQITEWADSTASQGSPVNGPVFPMLNIFLPGLYQPLLDWYRRLDRDSVGVAAWFGQPTLLEAHVARRAQDQVDVFTPVGNGTSASMRFLMDRDGRICELLDNQTTVKVTFDRTEHVNLDSIARAFGGRDAVGTGLGDLAPRDTTQARVGAVELSIDYGRPSRRGRTIFGVVVLEREVWRTGANLATHLTVSRRLIIGGASVPAGTYTLWTIPSRHEPVLIINRETGQWGTNYDRSRDLVRVPMRRTVTGARVEQMLIAVRPADEAGSAELLIAWDDAEFRVTLRDAGGG